jgi:hypothetical protein
MTTKRQKEQKKKDRERLNKTKALARQESARNENKKMIEERAREKEAYEMANGKPKPIFNNPKQEAEFDAIRARIVSDKIKKNLEVLQALEAEYEAEQRVRNEVNEKLESEGHMTMREKMDALHEKALKITDKADALAEAHEEYALQQKNMV